ncbi:MAG: DUF2961 domain-containing protein [Spirochaetaceae bacterium]|nr:DUF2961 domain-containing protein [Spirochaetaceae bacterium]
MDFYNNLGGLIREKHGRSRAINAENPRGEKGGGGIVAGTLGSSRKGSPCIRGLESGKTYVLAEMDGPGIIQHIWITVTDRTDQDYYVLRDLVLRMYWDGEDNPSVEAPLGDFFCCGFARGCDVNSLPIVVNPKRAMNSYFPMPFRKKAKITIENQHAVLVPAFFYQVDYCLYDELPSDTVYFHAQWRRERLTQKQKDYILVDGIKGKGHYVGTYFALTTLERYWWGEGEIKFYLDGDRDYPTICGTGTEDYFGGAWSFGALDAHNRTIERTYTTPFLGYVYYSHHDTEVFNPYHNDDTMPQRGFYRWHIMDPILFTEDLRVTLQQIGVCHKGLFERQDDAASVAYWYQTEPHNDFPAFPRVEDRWPR